MPYGRIDNGWKVAAIAHTHIKRNDMTYAGFSDADMDIINRYETVGYMMEYSDGTSPPPRQFRVTDFDISNNLKIKLL